MKITIVIATFNNVATLEQALFSIIYQLYQKVEIIIIDGGSTDGTVDLLIKYQQYIAYWISEPDSGIYDALNKGVKNATGDYVYFMGADDALYEKETLTMVAQALKNGIVMLCGDVWQVDEYTGYEILSSAKEEYDKKFFIKTIPHHQGMFVKMDVFHEFFFDIQYKIGADYDLFWKIYRKYGDKAIQCVNFPIAYFSTGMGATSHIEEAGVEYTKIMKIYDLPDEAIYRYNQFVELNTKKRGCIKKKIKTILLKTGLFFLVRRVGGWHKHHCQWDKCRWCKQ